MKKDFSCQKDKKITVHEKNKTHQVDMEKISHITCDCYLSTIHIIDSQETITHSKLLKYYETELSEYGFIKTSRNTLINLKHIKSLEKNFLTLLNKQKVKISCRNISKIRKYFNN